MTPGSRGDGSPQLVDPLRPKSCTSHVGSGCLRHGGHRGAHQGRCRDPGGSSHVAPRPAASCVCAVCPGRRPRHTCRLRAAVCTGSSRLPRPPQPGTQPDFASSRPPLEEHPSGLRARGLSGSHAHSPGRDSTQGPRGLPPACAWRRPQGQRLGLIRTPDGCVDRVAVTNTPSRPSLGFACVVRSA